MQRKRKLGGVDARTRVRIGVPRVEKFASFGALREMSVQPPAARQSVPANLLRRKKKRSRGNAKSAPRERFYDEEKLAQAIIAPSVRTFLRKSSRSFAVSGPHFPEPIFLPSSSTTGMTSAAEPVRNASSAFQTS